jgi:hypothetical protein
MKKTCLVVALVAITSLVHANRSTVFSPVTVVNSTQNCDLTSAVAVGHSLTASDCSFSFNSFKTTAWGGGLLYCRLGGAAIDTSNQSASSWNCNPDTTALTHLNSYVGNSASCDFPLTCVGGGNTGGDCNPKPRTAPDAAATASLLSLSLAGVAWLRRKLT